MDKSTGEPFMAGGKEVTAEVTFIPEQPDGKIRVTFTFDAGGITEVTEIVVFERLYRDGMQSRLLDRARRGRSRRAFRHKAETSDSKLATTK